MRAVVVGSSGEPELREGALPAVWSTRLWSPARVVARRRSRRSVPVGRSSSSPMGAPALAAPLPMVMPLERFAEGLELYRRREALKLVLTP